MHPRRHSPAPAGRHGRGRTPRAVGAAGARARDAVDGAIRPVGLGAIHIPADGAALRQAGKMKRGAGFAPSPVQPPRKPCTALGRPPCQACRPAVRTGGPPLPRGAALPLAPLHGWRTLSPGMGAGMPAPTSRVAPSPTAMAHLPPSKTKSGMQASHLSGVSHAAQLARAHSVCGRAARGVGLGG